MKTTLLILVLALTGCGKGFVPEAQYHEPEFAGVVEDFLGEAAARGLDLSVNTAGVRMVFGDPGAAGECSSSLVHVRTITIDRAEWDSDETRRTAILLHELGHCVLNRDHRNDFIDGRKASIMHAHTIDGLALQLFHDQYLNELFGKEPI